MYLASRAADCVNHYPTFFSVTTGSTLKHCEEASIIQHLNPRFLGQGVVAGAKETIWHLELRFSFEITVESRVERS
jgi:hypothetical protein